VRAAMIRERDSSPCSDSDDKKETKLITMKNGCYIVKIWFLRFIEKLVYLVYIIDWLYQWIHKVKFCKTGVVCY
jgi:hypothetical protein